MSTPGTTLFCEHQFSRRSSESVTFPKSSVTSICMYSSVSRISSFLNPVSFESWLNVNDPCSSWIFVASLFDQNLKYVTLPYGESGNSGPLLLSCPGVTAAN